MADPISIAMIAMTVGSSIYGAASEADKLRDDAKIDQANAQTALLDGAREAEDIRRRERATSAEAMAALGMNGVVTDVGSAADLITQNAVEREFEILNARYRASQEYRNLETQAGQKRKAAKGVLIGGILRGVGQALGGVSNMQNAGAMRSASASVRMPGTSMPVPN